MRAIKERIFTFSLPLPLLLTNSLDVPRTKKEIVRNVDLQIEVKSSHIRIKISINRKGMAAVSVFPPLASGWNSRQEARINYVCGNSGFRMMGRYRRGGHG